MMRAYFGEPRISVLADYACYHWVLRDGGSNASWSGLDPESYFAFMREVLDVVDEHTEPGPFRDRLYARWYRGKMLNRVERVHSNPDSHRRALYEAMHELAVERFPRERRQVPAVQPAAAFAAAARRRLRGARGARRLREALRAQVARWRCGRSRARRADAGGGARGAALRARRRPARLGRRRADATEALAGSTSSCCSSSARRRRSTACRPTWRCGSTTPAAASRRRRRRRARDRGPAAGGRAARGRAVGGSRGRDRGRLPRRRARAPGRP